MYKHHSNIMHAHHKQIKRQQLLLKNQMFAMFIFVALKPFKHHACTPQTQIERQQLMLKNQMFAMFIFWLSSRSNITHAHHKYIKHSKKLFIRLISLTCSFLALKPFKHHPCTPQIHQIQTNGPKKQENRRVFSRYI